MTQENILSRLIVEETGEEYYIGTRGSVETVAIKLIAPTDIEWNTLTVIVQDLSNNSSQEINLSDAGECTFEIPHGSVYTVTFPYLEGYNQPNTRRYTASIASRNLDITYGIEYENLTIRVTVMSAAEDEDAAMFNNQQVKVISSTGTEYTGVIENAQVMIPVPYGTVYTIEMPHFEGLFHNHVNEQFTAGLISRNLIYQYAPSNLGAFGVDEGGNAYTLEQLEAMGVETASSLVRAVGFNTIALASSMRKDGHANCGFYLPVDIDTTVNEGAWASAQVDFGINNPTVAAAMEAGNLSEGCGYYSSENLAYAVKDGSGESALVLQVGQLLADAGELNQNNPTPIFNIAKNQKLTIGGIERTGFVLSYGQLKDLSTNKTSVDAIYAAIGKTFPNINSGFWWSSCQNSATGAVLLYGGAFFNRSLKTASNSVLVGFDL